jgi:hypothetical protein
MRPSPRETSWDAWLTGLLRVKTENVVDEHNTTETSEVGYAKILFPDQENTFFVLSLLELDSWLT